jgi:hypothetical protein
VGLFDGRVAERWAVGLEEECWKTPQSMNVFVDWAEDNLDAVYLFRSFVHNLLFQAIHIPKSDHYLTPDSSK